MSAKSGEFASPAPFNFSYVEEQLRKKNFGILGTVDSQGRPHSVGVVYAVSPKDKPFCIYLITRPVLRKARNIRANSNVSFVVPYPHYLFRMLPPACIQFQGRAQFVPIDDTIALRAFQSSIVLQRSMNHSLHLGESTFVKIMPDGKIFSFGINASVWQYLFRSRNKELGNFYVHFAEIQE